MSKKTGTYHLQGCTFTDKNAKIKAKIIDLSYLESGPTHFDLSMQGLPYHQSNIFSRNFTILRNYGINLDNTMINSVSIVLRVTFNR